ncbi:SLC13/DASS family transporter [bacterium]|nr:MAG: SLC13/DASS family transporter [bacterium]
MKNNRTILKKFEFIGLVIGLLGSAFFLTGPFDSLTVAGHISLAIFWLAAWFYISEPIPVYATSLLVMLLGALLLSKEGPIFINAKPDLYTLSTDSTGIGIVPNSALFNQNSILVYEKGNWRTEPVSISKSTDSESTISFTANTNVPIAANAYTLNSGYEPLSYKTIFGTLANPIIVLFLGGFMLARGAVKYKLDNALTAYLLRPFGKKPAFILFGLILVTAILSAFMSNTATTAMMMTVILPIIAAVPDNDKFKTAIVLSIPVAANIGGIATPIGTPPNAIVVAALAQHKISIPFSDWVIMALPFTLVLLFLAWFLLHTLFKTDLKELNLDVNAKFNKSPKAIFLYFVFGFTILLWFTENLHGIPSGMVAFVPITLLTFGTVLDKNDIHSLSWEVLWLVAGGMSLGMLLDKTGVAVWIIQAIDWSMFNIVIILLVFAVIGWILANFMSHTVTATLLMPLGVSLGVSANLGDSYNVVIATMVIGIATSISMILPISTPPNAIAVATNLVNTKDMAKIGLIIGLIGIPLMLTFAWFYWTLFY